MHLMKNGVKRRESETKKDMKRDIKILNLGNEKSSDEGPIKKESSRKIKQALMKSSESSSKSSATEEDQKSMQLIAKDMPEIQMLKLQNSVTQDISENQIGSYEPQQSFFHRELLASTSLLNESTMLLHDQTKSLLKVNGDPEFRKVESYNMEQARTNMNTIAKLIQTKINFIKAVKTKN